MMFLSCSSAPVVPWDDPLFESFGKSYHGPFSSVSQLYFSNRSPFFRDAVSSVLDRITLDNVSSFPVEQIMCNLHVSSGFVLPDCLISPVSSDDVDLDMLARTTAWYMYDDLCRIRHILGFSSYSARADFTAMLFDHYFWRRYFSPGRYDQPALEHLRSEFVLCESMRQDLQEHGRLVLDYPHSYSASWGLGAEDVRGILRYGIIYCQASALADLITHQRQDFEAPVSMAAEGFAFKAGSRFSDESCWEPLEDLDRPSPMWCLADTVKRLDKEVKVS